MTERPRPSVDAVYNIAEITDTNALMSGLGMILGILPDPVAELETEKAEVWKLLFMYGKWSNFMLYNIPTCVFSR